jgi:hypothetical protein
MYSASSSMLNLPNSAVGSVASTTPRNPAALSVTYGSASMLWKLVMITQSTVAGSTAANCAVCMPPRWWLLLPSTAAPSGPE